MAVHKLIFDDVFDEVLFTLVAIHSNLEDYRLAYLLNNNLGTTLTRRKQDLDYNNGNASYSIFEWYDYKSLTTWSLVSNICKKESFQHRNDQLLFNSIEKITRKFHLLPEYKNVNYFLKVDSEFKPKKEKYIITSILKIPQIATAYSIDTSQLKSKDNLIFS